MSTVEGSVFPFADAVERIVLAVSRRWLAALTGYGVLALALPVAAPLLKAAGLTLLSTPIYFAYSFICHQQADRSLHIHDEPMAFCIRDMSIFAGAVMIAIVYLAVRHLRSVASPCTWLLLLAIIPIGVDGFTQLAGLRESNTLIRIATGLVFSMALGWYLLPRLESGFQSLEADIESRGVGQPIPVIEGSVARLDHGQ